MKRYALWASVAGKSNDFAEARLGILEPPTMPRIDAGKFGNFGSLHHILNLVSMTR